MMGDKEIKCPYCDGSNLYIGERISSNVMICNDCNNWIKWVGKKDLKMIQGFINNKPQSKINNIDIDNKLVKEILIEHIMNKITTYKGGVILDEIAIETLLNQQIQEDSELIKDIINNGEYDIDYNEDILSYNSLEIYIYFNNSEIKYNYKLNIWEELKLEGYCDCTDKDERYNKEYHCCGIDCDWYSPAVQITKRAIHTKSTWDGTQKSFWNSYEEILSKKSKEVKDTTIDNKRKNELLDVINKAKEELDNL